MTEEEKKERLRKINGFSQGTQTFYTNLENSIEKANKTTMSIGKFLVKVASLILSILIIIIIFTSLFSPYGSSGVMIPSLLFVLAILNIEGIWKLIKKCSDKEEKKNTNNDKSDIITEEDTTITESVGVIEEENNEENY